MSTKGAKKSSNGKKKIKKKKSSHIKQKSDANPPRKIKSKPKSLGKSKANSDVLPKIKKKKKQSPPKNNHKSDDKSDGKIKRKKRRKSRKSNAFEPICTDSTPDSAVTSKPKGIRKKRKNSKNIENIKKQLQLSYSSTPSTPSSSKADQNIFPNSAKKMLKNPPKKNKKQIQAQSMKKSKDVNREQTPRRTISEMFGFGKKAKKKTSDLIPPKAAKKKKKKSELKQTDIAAKKRKKKTDDSESEFQKPKLHKLKKKPVQPSSTEKLNLFRRKNKPKTKSKKKPQLYIGDYVHVSLDKWGLIRYKGALKNVTGIWYGIELLGEDLNGDCNGMFNDEVYFKCAANAGLFAMYQMIESKLKTSEVEKLLKKKRKRAHTSTLSQKLANQMSFKNKKKKKGKKKSTTNEHKIKPKAKKNKKKRSAASASSTPTDESSENAKTSKFKWEIPSAAKVCTDTPVASYNYPGPMDASESEEESDIWSRGRKLSLPETNHSNKRRARSLSVNRDDKSWMTHKKEAGNSADRIKQNILQQKQLDLRGLMELNSNNHKKKEISKLFEKHIETANLSNGCGGGGGGGGGGAAMLSVGGETERNKLRDRLKNEEEALENAVGIVRDLGFLKYIRDDAVYSKIYIKKDTKRSSGMYLNVFDDEKMNEVGGNEGSDSADFDLFDMNNIDILSKFEGKMRDILSKVLCKAIVSIPSIEILEICNCDIDSDFVEILCEYLCVNVNRISILSLQSNPIADRGMIALTKLIRLNNKDLTTIKLQNNRKDISTLICQQICQSLQDNEYIIKFELEFRHYQWRDFRDKIVKRNSEKARLNRLQMVKGVSI